MLYDPRRDKPPVYSVEGLIAWLETKPRDEWYVFVDANSCPIARYLKAMGCKDFALRHHQLDKLGWLHIVEKEPRTFGAALERARKQIGHFGAPDHTARRAREPNAAPSNAGARGAA